MKYGIISSKDPLILMNMCYFGQNPYIVRRPPFVFDSARKQDNPPRGWIDLFVDITRKTWNQLSEWVYESYEAIWELDVAVKV